MAEMTRLEEMLYEQAPDAIIYADREGIIRKWNAAAETLFGFSQQEALGQSLDLIIPEQFREAHWTGYNRALAEGETKYRGKALPTRSHRKDGETIYVELTFAIVRYEGQVQGALAHARDITERWAREREQRQRLREAEARLEQAEAGARVEGERR
jgi:PAS domain S-box-containing protein